MGVCKKFVLGHPSARSCSSPIPNPPPRKAARCDALLAALDPYLRNEHPAVEIDARQCIPRSVIDKLFQLGVLGMTIPAPNTAAAAWASPALQSRAPAHRAYLRVDGRTGFGPSIHRVQGIDALRHRGAESSSWLPHLAKDWLSAFCLSEPNVGCDAGGQETRCRLSEDGQYYILNGEKKWATSGALSGLFTVMAKQTLTDPATGKTVDKITALVCTPDMERHRYFSEESL